MGESVLDAFSCPCGMCFGVRLKCVLGSSVSCPPADPRAHVSLEKDAFLIRFRSVWGSVWGSVLAPAPAGPQNGFANGSPNRSETDRKRIDKRIQNGSKAHPPRGKRGSGIRRRARLGVRLGSVGGSVGGFVLDPFAGPAGLGPAGLDPKSISPNGSKTDRQTDPKRIQNGSPNGFLGNIAFPELAGSRFSQQ